jgi:hypothetical protein
MHAYGTKHSDHQIQILPIPNESHFTKFNAHQSFPAILVYLMTELKLHKRKKNCPQVFFAGIIILMPCSSFFSMTYPCVYVHHTSLSLNQPSLAQHTITSQRLRKSSLTLAVSSVILTFFDA